MEWISKESIQRADQVEKAILETIEKTAVNPERFPPDKFKRDNPGIFRAFETHNYRISFTFNEEEVRILRGRHVKQKPIEY